MYKCWLSSVIISVLLITGCTPEKKSKLSLPEERILKQEAPALDISEREQSTATFSKEPAQPLAPNESKGQADESPTAAAALTPVDVMARDGKMDNIAISGRLSGEVRSKNKATLAFRVGGFIKEIKALPGERCKAGEILANLDPRDYKINLEMAGSQLEMAILAMETAGREFERETQLRNENVSTDSSFDRIKAAYDKARLDRQMADLRQQQANQAFEDTNLRAPYDCVVTQQFKNVGENVPVGNGVIEVYSTSELELVFSVPEKLIGMLKIGDQLNVSIPTAQFNDKLPVKRLVPVVMDTSRTFQVIVTAPVGNERVIPGLFAEAIIQ